MTKNSTRGKSRKRMRLPNGFGRITKLNGRLRKPYRVMVTIGKDEYGKPIGKLLKPQAYFETYNEAYMALVEYNKDPYDVTQIMTVEEVYNRWKEQYFLEVSKPTIKRVKTAWDYFGDVKDVPIKNIRPIHIRRVLDEGVAVRDGEKRVAPEKFKKYMKQLWNRMFEYALEYGYVDRNYAREVIVRIKDNTYKAHMVFTKEEMDYLWAHKDDKWVRYVLIQCYSGFRPAEVLKLTKDNIHLDENIMIGGSKTAAGMNRVVPIHPLIRELVMDLEEPGVHYSRYYEHFKNFIKNSPLNDNHRLHDGRKHFITLAKKYNMDEYALKRIVGHSIRDLTESVYTERSNEWLYEEMCKIKMY